MPNRFTPLNSSSSMPALVNQINQNFAVLDAEAVTKTFSGTGGINSIVQGRLPGDLGYGQILYDRSGNAAIYLAVDADGNTVLKVAKATKDAVTGSADDLVFNSNQNTFKIIESGTVELNRPGGTASVNAQITVPGGAAAFFSWGTITNASPNLTYPLPYYAPNGTGGLLWGVRAFYDASVGAVKFFHESYDAGTTASTINLSVKYYLMQETLV